MLSQLDQSTKTTFVTYIDRRWQQLYELERGWAEKAVKYLLLTNSGGAIATLSFLGTSDQIRHPLALKFALLFFASGVLLLGIFTAMMFHKMAQLLRQYTKSVKDFYTDKIAWEYLIEEDEKRVQRSRRNYVVPHLSFLCFLLGIGTEAWVHSRS
jgi:hypothetical protein